MKRPCYYGEHKANIAGRKTRQTRNDIELLDMGHPINGLDLPTCCKLVMELARPDVGHEEAIWSRGVADRPWLANSQLFRERE
jgi:hypothetical protein